MATSSRPGLESPPDPAPPSKPKAVPAPKPVVVMPVPAAKPAPSPVAPARTGVVERLRKRQARQLVVRLALFVLLPTLLAAGYYGGLASDQYESFSHVTVHSSELRPSLGIESLLGITGAPATRDTLVVRDYVLSRDMLARLERDHGFIEHFRQPGADVLTRLPADATFEEAYEYYESKVRVDFDSTSGTLTVRVRALSPEKAQELGKAVIRYSEEMVNQLSQREREDQIRFAQADVDKSEKRLVEARKKLLAQQQKHAEFDPLQTARSAMMLRTEIESELARAKAELMEAKSYMTDDAPRVVALAARVKSLSAQASQEKRRLVDPKRAGGIADSMAEFEEAAVEKELAQKSYEASMTALELARSTAARQHRYLATISSPSLPDDSTYPRRGLGVLTVFVLSFLLLGVGSLLIASVREHARV